MFENYSKKLKVHLDSKHLRIVREILKSHDLLSFAFVFGSRVIGSHRPYSDLDLLIKKDRPLELKELVRLQTSFEESDLPIQIDIVDWHKISEGFKKQIEPDLISLE